MLPVAATTIVRVVTENDTPTWVVAIATVLLFIATFFLFLMTRRMVGTAAAQVTIDADRAAAAQRPHVYPVTLTEWAMHTKPYDDSRWSQMIPIANAGPGIAHNTTGILRLSNGVSSSSFHSRSSPVRPSMRASTPQVAWPTKRVGVTRVVRSSAMTLLG